MSVELVIVGGGNMGAALLGGMIASGTAPQHLAVVETLADRRDQLAQQFPGVVVSASVTPCPAAVIAVKPPDVPEAVCAAVSAGARRVLSIAAGVSVATIQSAAGDGVAVVRAMPNTPALVGQGASAIAGGESATDDDLTWAENVLGAVGTVARVDEADLDAVTALSGSGPAYLFLVAEALIDAGESAGLDRSLAESLTTQLFVGSAALLADRGNPATLREMVTSPGGTTAAGLHVLEARAVRAAIADAVHAAATRSAELGAR
jgi:pyrroline-5-carboxylate reductase